MNTSKPPTLRHILVFSLAVIMVITALAPAWTVKANGSLALSPLAAPVTIYGDSLASGWQDWSWSASRNLSNTSPVQSGADSVSVTITSAWGALYLHKSTALSTTGYTNLEFYINGGTSGSQRLNVIVNKNTSKYYTVTAVANTWVRVSIPLTSLGSPASLVDLFWQDALGKAQPKFYLDSIRLVGSTTSATATATRVGPTAAPTKAGQTSTPTRIAPTATRPAATATPISTSHFNTLPPGSALPSDAQCAASVRHVAENKRMNATYNATRGNQTVGSTFAGGAGTSIYNSRITGNFTGTTDEILQWVACKWGIDEDIVRAQAAKESWWRQTVKGDWTTDSTRCAPGHGLGVDGTAGQCPESFGILQNRYPYEQDSWPGIYNSTAWNADVAYAYWRACYEGYTTWLGSGYARGDAWGCVGRWFAGAWHTSAAETYITAVKDYYNQRIWEDPDFQEP